MISQMSYQKEGRRRFDYRREDNVTTEAVFGVIQPQAKEHPGP